MKKLFKSVAISAALAIAPMSSAHADTDCNQLYEDMMNLYYTLTQTQNALDSLDYENTMKAYDDWLAWKYQECEGGNPSFITECKMDAEQYVYDEKVALTETKEGIEWEIYGYQTTLSAMLEEWENTPCY